MVVLYEIEDMMNLYEWLTIGFYAGTFGVTVVAFILEERRTRILEEKKEERTRKRRRVRQ